MTRTEEFEQLPARAGGLRTAGSVRVRLPEIASAVGRSEAACRQLSVRARRHMDAGRPRFEADRREREKLAARFFSALAEGDVDGLQELVAADVQLAADGGGKTLALARSIIGAEKVARVLASMFPWLVRIDVTVQPIR